MFTDLLKGDLYIKTKNKKKKTLLIYLKMDETLVMVLVDLKFETSFDRNLPSSPVARI